MPPDREFLILDGDRPQKQDAWVEERDAKDRVIKPTRPARDEVEVSIRLNRQYRAQVRLPRAEINTVPKRQRAIADACARLGLGEEIARGVQVVEVEERFTEAREAMVTPEEKDEQGNVVKEESYSPPTEERVDFSFTLRINGIHLQKLSLSEAEVKQANWKQALAGKVAAPEVFTRG